MDRVENVAAATSKTWGLQNYGLRMVLVPDESRHMPLLGMTWP